ncbi:glycosyltransferase family 2 protein [[Erwinia] mediterraneensis]|uniref:glycosyltransferase family 2 protein n=1 Tax=[Erwinia] mediterraneensis TaxID=2161819 RepID=UPI0010326833|nr:glycosyltransferase family 2 protein [[Erwinia] mediterraneensis]
MAASCTLSVLITVHNCAPWLEETLRSVDLALQPISAHCEVVIINDASSDGSGDIITGYCQQRAYARFFTTELRNIGQVRNYAVAQAQGEYVLMLDGDDRLLPQAVAQHFRILSEQAPDILLNKIIEQRAQDTPPDWQFQPPQALSRDEAIRRFLVHRDFQAHFIGQYFRRQLLLDHPFPPFICYEDAWLFPQLLTLSQNTLYSPAGFYLYRKHQNSLSTVMSDEKIICLLAATRQMDQVLPDKFQALITCHWIDVLNRHHAALAKLGEQEKVKARIRQIGLLPFLLNSQIRLSYKRKMLKVRR